MAINDWLTPQAAPLQPSFLTSRAAGAVLPDYFTQSAEIAKTRLGIAGQEQQLRLNEEQAARAREEAALQRSGRETTASLLPRLSELDVNDPEYYSKLYGIVSEPGMANALTDRSMSEFLGLQQRARGEITDRQRFGETRKAQEKAAKAAEARAAEREERQFARQTAKSMYDYAENLGLKVDDPSFAMRYMDDLKNYDKLNDMERAQLQGRINLDYSQKVLADQLTALQIDPDSDEAEDYKITTEDGRKILSANKIKIKAAQARQAADDRRLRLSLLSRTPGPGATAEEKAAYEEIKKELDKDTGAANPFIPRAGGGGKATSAE
jgi:hypothetical protein